MILSPAGFDLSFEQLHQRFEGNAVIEGCWSAAKVSLRKTLDPHSPAFDPREPEMDPQNVSNIFWACATVGTPPPDSVREGLLARVVQIAEQGRLNRQDVPNLSWALGRLRIWPGPEVASALEKMALQEHEQFTPQGK